MITDNKGMTLIELMVVISVIGILVVALGFQYAGWQGRYKAETQVREIYADLTDARLKAMQQNRPYGISISGTSYRVIRSTDDVWTSFTAAPGWNTVKGLAGPYWVTASGWATLPGTVRFNSRGLADPWTTTITLRLREWNTSNPPDYTCVLVNQMKINLGWMTPQGSMSGDCIEK